MGTHLSNILYLLRLQKIELLNIYRNGTLLEPQQKLTWITEIRTIPSRHLLF